MRTSSSEPGSEPEPPEPVHFARSRSRKTVLLGSGAGAGLLTRSRSRSRPKMSRLRIPAYYIIHFHQKHNTTTLTNSAPIVTTTTVIVPCPLKRQYLANAKCDILGIVRLEKRPPSVFNQSKQFLKLRPQSFAICIFRLRFLSFNFTVG